LSFNSLSFILVAQNILFVIKFSLSAMRSSHSRSRRLGSPSCGCLSTAGWVSAMATPPPSRCDRACARFVSCGDGLVFVHALYLVRFVPPLMPRCAFLGAPARRCGAARRRSTRCGSASSTGCPPPTATSPPSRWLFLHPIVFPRANGYGFVLIAGAVRAGAACGAGQSVDGHWLEHPQPHRLRPALSCRGSSDIEGDVTSLKI
jgi:hypothetical protein